MITYIILAAVAAGLLALFAIINKAMGEGKCTRHKSLRFLTESTPVSLSLDEVKSAGLQQVIKDRAPEAMVVDVEGVTCIQISIPEFLDVLLQKCGQHEKEIGDIVKVLPKKKVAKKASKKK